MNLLMKKLKEKRYVALILMVVLIIFIVLINKIGREEIYKENIVLEKATAEKMNGLKADITEGIVKGNEEIEYEVKYALSEGEEKRTVILKASLTEEEGKYAQFKEIKSEKIESEVSNDGRKIEVKIKEVEPGVENIVGLKIIIKNAPNGVIIKPKVEIKEENEEEYKEVNTNKIEVRTRSITGIVIDETKNRVNDIELKIINEEGEEVKRTYSDKDGRYTFNELEIGKYRVEAAEEKYEVVNVKEIEVNESQVVNIEIKEVKPYDIRVKKYVNKVKLKINGKEKEYTYGKIEKVNQAVKNLKEIEGEIEYKVEIENIGKKEGIVTKAEVSIGEGLKFSEEKNAGWKIKNGNIRNEEIEGISLKAGEKRELKLKLDIEKTKEAKEYLSKITVMGEVYEKVSYILDNEIYKEEEILEGEKIEELKIEDEKFTGWYTDKNYTNKYDFDKEVRKDIILYGKRKNEVKKYRVTFVDTIGEIIETKEYEEGSIIDKFPEYSVKEGYKFTGWENERKEKIEEPLTVIKDEIITATEEITKYKITFVNYDDSELQSETLNYGSMPVYKGNVPTKKADKENRYIFEGWSPEIETVTKEQIYKAKYKEEKIKYTVRYEDEEENQIYTEEKYNYKEEITLKEGPERSHYDFVGWYINGEKKEEKIVVEDNVTLVGKYEKTNYQIKYINEGQCALCETHTYGDVVIVEDPSKEGYNFIGWYTEKEEKIENIITVEKSITAYARYEIKKYTVKFYNEGKEIESLRRENVEHFSVIEKPEYEPEKEDYNFKNWVIRGTEKEYSFTEEITGNLELESTYTKKPIYEVTFVIDNEEITKVNVIEGKKVSKIEDPIKTGYLFDKWYKEESLETEYNFETEIIEGPTTIYGKYDEVRYEVEYYNEEVLFETSSVLDGYEIIKTENKPTKEGYTFRYWSLENKSDVEEVPGEYDFRVKVNKDMTEENKIKLYAVYERNGYEIKFVNYDDSELQSEIVKYKEMPVYKGVEPTRLETEEYRYNFIGWDKEIEEATKNEIYKATYEEIKRSYNIKFIDDDGRTLCEEIYEYGSTPSCTEPTKEADVENTYTFSGWTPEIAIVTGEKTYQATYEKVKNKYRVTFINNDGSILQEEEIEYGNMPVYKGDIPERVSTIEEQKENTYTFNGWTPEITNVVGHAVYQAEYEITPVLYGIEYYDGETKEKLEGKYDLLYNSTLEEIKEGIEKEHKIFLGWYINEGEELLTNETKMIEKPLKVYSKYELVEKPVIEIEPTEWTKENVTVTIKNESHPEYRFKYKIDEGEYIEYNGSFEVSENCLVVAKSIKEETESEQERKEITNIDKVKPNIISASEGEITPKSIGIKVTAQDNESGLKEIRIYKNEELVKVATYEEIKETELEYIIDNLEELTTYQIKVEAEDLVGNISEIYEKEITTTEKTIVARIVGREGTLYETEEEYEKYESLSEAIERCGESTNACMIEMLRSTEESVEILETQNIEINLNGKEIVYTGSQTILNNGELSIIDKLESEIGSIRNTEGIGIQNNKLLTLGINEEERNVSKEKPSIYGKEKGISGGQINFYDGRVEGLVAVDGEIIDTPYLYNVRVEDANNQIATLTILAEAEARINGTRYYTQVQGAVNDTLSGTYRTETTTTDNLINILETDKDTVYGFRYNEEENVLESTNEGIGNSVSNSYVKIDLSNYTENQILSVEASISSQLNSDIGYATITESTSIPTYNNAEGRFIYISGEITEEEYLTTLEAGKVYYLHIGYRKDGNNNTGEDKFKISNIKLSSVINTENYVTPELYGFKNESGKLTSAGGIQGTVSNSYIKVDLTNETEDKKIIIDTKIIGYAPSSTGNDMAYVTITDNETVPAYSNSTGRILYYSGISSKSAEATLTAGKVNYIHLGYRLYYSNMTKFIINSIKYEDGSNVLENGSSVETEYTKEERIPVLNSEIDNVELLRDITLTSSLEVEETRSMVLDLNGKTLATTSSDYVIKNNGELRIIDSKYTSDVKKAQIDYENELATNQLNYEIALANYNKYKEDTQLAYDTTYISKLESYTDYEHAIEEYNKTHYEFDYTGSEQIFKVPEDGEYKIELWGAQGGSSLANNLKGTSGGLGGYTRGNITLKKDDIIYIYVGEKGIDASKGQDSNSSYNGGGLGTWDNADDEAAGAGGGATDIRLDISEDGSWNDFNSLKSRIMVAGAGGGAVWQTTGGAGGGLTGGSTNPSASGGTQTSGYKFGIGQNGEGTGDSDGVGGAGSGYYGGTTSGSYNSGNETGTGGSSFISGYEGCDAIDETSTEDNIIHTGQSIHYSELSFTDSVMISGNEEMPSHNGSNTMIGNEGNGYAKITLLGKESSDMEKPEMNDPVILSNIELDENNSFELSYSEEKTITSFKIYGIEDISKYPKTVELLGSKDGKNYETIVENAALEQKEIDEYNEVQVDSSKYDSYKYFKWNFINEGNVVEIGEIELTIYDVSRQIFNEINNVTPNTSNFTYNVQNTSYSTMENSDNKLHFYTSNGGNTSVTYYNEKIIVEEGKQYTINGKLGLWNNYWNNNQSLGTAYIGFSKTNEISTTDFDSYIQREINTTSEKIEDFKVTVYEPGEYYFKIVMYHNTNISSYTIYGNLYNLSYTMVPELKESTLRSSTLQGNITSTTGSIIYNDIGSNLVIDEAIININKAGTSSIYTNGITNYGTVTLNNDVTINNNQNYAVAIENKRTGNILNSNGTINVTGTTVSYGVRNNSIVNDEISGLKISLSNDAYGILHYSDKELLIDNVNIIGTGYAIYMGSKNVLNIENNNILGRRGIELRENNGIVNVNSGNITTSENTLGIYNPNVLGTININGGIIKTTGATGANNSHYAVYNLDGTINMSDGELYTPYIGIYNDNYRNNKLTVTGGYIESENSSIYYGGTQTATITGGKVYHKSGSSVHNACTGIVDISGDFKIDEKGIGYGISNTSSGILNISGNIEILGTNERGIYSSGGGTVNIKDNIVIKSTNSGIFNDNGTVNIGLKVKPEDVENFIDENGKEVYDEKVSNTYPKIESEKYGINNSSTVNWYDGVVIGEKNNGITGRINESEEGYDLLIKDESETLENITLSVPTIEEFGQVVKIDDTYYPSIQTAINSLQTNEQKTIEVLKDIRTISSNTMLENKNAILDISGHQIKTYSANSLIENKGQLKITDSTSVQAADESVILGSGALTSTGGIVVKNIGTLEVEKAKLSTLLNSTVDNIGNMILTDGEITNSDTTSNETAAVLNNESGNLVVNSGLIFASNAGGGVSLYNKDTATVTMNNGTIGGHVYYGHTAFKNFSTGKITINDGKIISTKSSSWNYSNTIINGSSGEIEINNGSIEATNISLSNTSTGKIVLKSGEIKSGYIENTSTGTILIGGYEEGENLIAVDDLNKPIINSYINNASTGILTILNGTIEASVNGVTIKNNGIANIIGGTIKNIYDYDRSFAISNTKTGTLTLGIKGDVDSDDNLIVSKTNPEIVHPTQTAIINEGVFNFYDGIIKGSTAINGSIKEVEEGYEIITESDETYSEIKYLDRLPVAKLLSTNEEYYDLQEAINASIENDTIEILRDVTILSTSDTITVPSDKNIIIDLKGYKVTSGNSLFMQNEGQLRITDSTSKVLEDGNVELGSGILTSTSGIVVKNDNNLTISNARMSTEGVTLLENTNGNLTIENSELSTNKAMNGINLINSTSTGKMTITKSQINALALDSYNRNPIAIKITNGELELNDSIIKAESNYDSGQIVNSEASAKVTVNGGTYTSRGRSIVNSGQFILNSGTFTSNYVDNINTGELIMNGGEIKAVVSNNGTGKIEINNGNITSDVPLKNISSGTIDIKDGTIEGTSHSLRNENIGIINIIGGTIKSTGTASYVSSVENTSTGIINIGIKGDVDEEGNLIVSKEKPLITSLVTAVSNSAAGTINFYDGIIKGSTAISGSVSEVEEGYEIITESNEEYNEIKYLNRLPVAKLLSTNEEYYDLQEAINASIENDTIQILRDVTILSSTDTVTVPSDKNIIIDLKGYKVTSGNSLFMQNEGQLKITDSTSKVLEDGSVELGNGVLTSTGGIVIKNIGTLEVEKAKLTSTSNSTVDNTGSMILTDGEITNNFSEKAEMSTILNNESGNLIINGGLIFANNGSVSLYNKDEATVTINKGRIEGSRSSAQTTLKNTSTGKITINGGEIISSGGSYYSHYAIVNESSGEIEINGGSIEADDRNLSNTSTGKIILKSGEVKSGVMENTSIGTILIGGYEEGENLVVVDDLNKPIINSYIQNTSTGIITILNGIVEVGNSQALINRHSGTINIMGGTIKNTGTYFSAIENISTGTINISNVTLENISIAISQTGKGIVNIDESVTINATDKGISNTGEGTVNIGKEDKIISITNPIINGTNYGIYNENVNGKINIYDGQIEGALNQSIYGQVTETEPGYKVKTDSKDVDGVTRSVSTLTVVGTEERVAVVNGMNFTNIQSAINATTYSEDASVETIVTLYSGISLTNNVIVPEGRNIKLYLNGNTINYNGYNFVTNGNSSIEVIGEESANSLLGSIVNKVKEVLNIDPLRKNIVVYEMEDGSKLLSNKTYSLYKEEEKIHLEEDEEIGRYKEGKEDVLMKTVRGRLYINNLEEGNYKVIDNDGKEAIFSVTDKEVLGNAKESIYTSKNKIIRASVASLIITIQTGGFVSNLLILLILLMTICLLLYLIQRKKGFN